MSKALDTQKSFSGGEVSPLLDARTDLPAYTASCRQMQNMIALRQGAVTRRPGSIFIGKAKFENTDTWQYADRLVSFRYSPTTSFVLEMGHNYIRFYSNKQPVTLATAPGWISGTAYVVGNFVQDPGDGNRIYYCIVSITGPTQPHSDPGHWALQSIYEVPTPYNGRADYSHSIYDSDVWTVVPCQINDVVYFVNPNYPPYKLTRLADTNWVFEQVNFLTPAMLDLNPTTVYLGPSATTGAVIVNANAPVWVTATYYAVGRSVNSGQLYTCLVAHVSGAFAADLANGYWRQETIFTAGNVGGYLQLGYVRNTVNVTQNITANGISAQVEATGKCTFATYGVWNAICDLERSDDYGATWVKVQTIQSVSDHNGDIEVTVVGKALFRVNVSSWVSATGTPRAVFMIKDAVQYGLIKVTGYVSNTQVNGVVVDRLPSANTTTIWAEGAWSVRRGFPQAITAYQQRMIYGGSSYEPQRIWGTVTDDLENFNLGDGTLATDSFAFDLAAVSRGRIQWLISQTDLLVGFAGAEWIVNAGAGSFGGSSEPITPQQINAGEHSSWGSAPGIAPLLIGNTVVYPQRTGRTLQLMMFSVYTNKYQSQDITMYAEHLFSTGIVQLDYQPVFRSQGLMWVVTRGGGLMGMTYDAQSNVYAWHRHVTELEDDGSVNAIQSVASIPGSGNEDDQVWIVVPRQGGRCIEMLNPVVWETSASPTYGLANPKLANAIYVDAAVTITKAGSGTSIPGFNHLVNYLGQGSMVIGLIDGLFTFGPVQVQADGTIVVEYPWVGGELIQAGLPMRYAAEGMRMDADGQFGDLFGITKAISRVYLQVLNSLSGKLASNGVKKVPFEYRKKSTPTGQVGQLTTGEIYAVPDATQSTDPAVIIEGDDPLPLTLLATTVRVGITGSK